MKLVRGRTAAWVDLVADKLMPDTDTGSVQDYVAVLKHLIRENSDQMFLLAVIDDTAEEVVIEGYIIAIDVENYGYILISQFWCTPKASQSGFSDLCFFRAMNWALERGKRELRIETARDETAVSRRWGFKVLSRTMALNINEEFEIRMIQELGHNFLKSGGNDEFRQRTKIGEHSDGRAEILSPSTGGLHSPIGRTGEQVSSEQSDRQEGGGVSGTDNPRPEPGVWDFIKRSDRTAEQPAGESGPVQSTGESVTYGSDPQEPPAGDSEPTVRRTWGTKLADKGRNKQPALGEASDPAVGEEHKGVLPVGSGGTSTPNV